MFFPDSTFHPSQLNLSKEAKSLRSVSAESPFNCSTLGWAPGLTYKNIRLEFKKACQGQTTQLIVNIHKLRLYKSYHIWPWGLYYKTLQTCILHKLDRFRSSLTSSIVSHKHTSLLRNPYITEPYCFIELCSGDPFALY